ncbi:glycosyltransferase family 4 protein [Sphingomonas sp. 1P08PE]|uniref:glycosyltransferase family 4 protein n=1 Tax=Sphingomonas sp. 1P08PE TaxID=554122 RepID=UPI0039A186E3
MAPDLRFRLLRHPSHPERLTDAVNVVEQVVPHAANGPATMWWLPEVVDLAGVDLFHATFNIMPAGLSMPCVVTIHDIMRLTHPNLCRTGIRGEIERRFYGHGIVRAIRSAGAIAAISSATADAIAAYHPEAGDRTHVTRSGVSEQFQPRRPDPAALQALGIAPGRPFVLTVGQDAPYKNHEGALRSFALAFADRPDIELVMVQRGAGPRGRLAHLARSLGIDSRVRFMRTIGTDELVTLYGAACALLHPSFVEGFGNPVAEAMACGCPVITSSVSSMPEVAGGAALLADPEDIDAIAHCLNQVIGSPILAQQMRAAGLIRARSMLWRDFAAANLSIYRRILAFPGGAKPDQG